MMLADVDQRLRRVLGEALQRTERGDLAWTRIVGAKNPAYIADLGKGSLSIRSLSPDGGPPYRFTLLNKSGVGVRQLESRVVRDQPDAERDDAVELNQQLSALFELVYRKSLGIDDALESVETALDIR